MEKISEIARLQRLMLEAFGRLSAKEADELSRSVTDGALKRGFTYMRPGGRLEAVHLMLVPSFITEEQAAYLHGLSLAVKRGVEAVCGAWQSDDELKKMLPFDDEEERWITGLHKGRPASGYPLWYRCDAHFHMKEPGWKDAISIFEINACAVGGIQYSPTADSLFLETILPALERRLPPLPPFRKNPDLRDLLGELMSAHARAIGRRSVNIAFAEDATLQEGITEGPYIVEHLKKMGFNANLADPRELFVKGGEIYFKDTMIDLVYRNFELSDMIEMERQGDDVGAVRHAFSNNQVISSLCGDFDHKSMWEALSSGSFDRYFAEEDAALFKKHLLWTRLVSERKTEGPAGLMVDLIPFALKNKDMLVLKPNRLCGGYGVTIGKNTGGPEWEAMVLKAAKEGNGWVVQKFAAPEEFVFPLFEDVGLVFENHNIVYGISSTPWGTGILGRVSRESVVNVARQGGLMPVLRIA